MNHTPHYDHYDPPGWYHRVIDNLYIFWTLIFRRGKVPISILPQDTVVVVLDVIVPYSSLWGKSNSDELRNMLRQVRGRGHRVLFTRWCRTRQYPNDAIGAMKNPHWSYFLPEAALDAEGKSALIHPELVECHDDVLDAVYTNILAHPSINLQARAPLLLCGMWTESCILNTARAATEDDREVFVYAPACAGHIGWYALWTIQALYGRVIHRLM